MKNHNKSAISNFFQAIIEYVRELVISNAQNNFERDIWKCFKLSHPQGKIIYIKCKKLQ